MLRRQISSLTPVRRLILAFGAGALAVPAFAPFSLFPLALVAVVIIFLLWQDASPRQALLDGLAFGLGLLGFGVFWMHISIDQFGNVGTALAILITLGFILLMALYYGLVGWAACRLTPAGSIHRMLVIPLLWVLVEWLRGWVLTGFPWLAMGYSQIESPLAGLAPLLGVYGVSLGVTLSAAGLALVLSGAVKQRWGVLTPVILLWLSAGLLLQLNWTASSGGSLSVSMIQGNVAQEAKWKRENLQPTLALYGELTRQHWGSDLIIWPETAVPAFAHQIDKHYLTPLESAARRNESALLMGIPVWHGDEKQYYNAMLALGEERDRYYKRHLVPFGEFMPLKGLLKPLIDWLQIPMSDFTPGNGERPLLKFGGYPVGVSICYEDAFGDEMIQALPDAAFLVNASNDAWFGDSLAPHQHLEIARMRALEAGRYLLRSTNTGISAIVGPKGELVTASPAFEKYVLTGEILPMEGATPYVRIGNWGVISLVLMLLAGGIVAAKRGS
ncbi:MAG: apolipoprotein N-acyltransferase [Candidatus Sedimenticola sp. PURPLELP]